LNVQWYLLWATLLAFGAAAYYALIAKQQLATINETLQEVHVQNVAQERALLSVPNPPTFWRTANWLSGLRIVDGLRQKSVNVTSPMFKN
jgi:acyl-CoA synthetase (NDP forming)